jgi:uncharacterized protein
MNPRASTYTHPGPGRLALAYTLVTCALSWSFIWAATTRFQIPAWAFLIGIMWIPGTVSIAFRIAFREGFDDAGFHPGRLRYWLLASLVPLALATATYLVAWLFRQVEINPYLRQQSMFGPQIFPLTWFDAGTGTLGLLAQRFAVVLTLGIAVGFVSGLGEEIGWRGYLLPRLIQSGVRRPLLVSGLIWAAWHVPFVLLTYQHQPYVTAVLYSLLCVVVANFIGWLRLASGSVFVAAMAHGAYNTFYQDFYEHSFFGPHRWFWAGEVGLLCSVAFGALALWLDQTGRLTTAIKSFSDSTKADPQTSTPIETAGPGAPTGRRF